MSFMLFGKKRERGVIFVICAFVLPVMLLLTGLAIDFAFLYVQRNRLQDVADATALAAARKMSQEGRYAGAKATDDKKDMAVGKEIIAFVKENDSDFEGFSINEVVYKGKYFDEEGTGVFQAKENRINDSTNKFVKLVDLESWTKPVGNDGNKNPRMAGELRCKIEYAITGRLNSQNFLDENVDNEGNHISDFTEDDRVRVRLTKRVPLLFLSIVLSDEYANGVPLTVMAAAKPASEGASGSGDSTANTNVKVPVIFANPMNFGNTTPSQFNDTLVGSGAASVDTGFYAIYGNDTNYGLNDAYVAYQSSGYFCIKAMQTQDVTSYLRATSNVVYNNATSKWRVFRIGESGYGSGAHLVAQQQSNGQWRVGFTNSFSFSKDYNYYEAKLDGNNIEYTAVDKSSAMGSVIDLWLTDIIRLKECYASIESDRARYSNYSDYTVKLYSSNQDSYAGLNRLYSYFDDSNNNKRKDRSEAEGFDFDPDNFSLYVNTGGNPSEFGKYVVGNSNSLQKFVLTNYHLVYNRNWYQNGKYVSDWTAGDGTPLDYSTLDQENSSLAQVKDIKFLGTNGNLVIATDGVTYGDIYSQGDIYILGSNNKVTGNIYCANNLHIGGENNSVFSYVSKEDTYDQKYIYTPNSLNYNDWKSSVSNGGTASSNSVTVQVSQVGQNNPNPDFSINIGNDYWQRVVSEVPASPARLVE